MFETVVEKFSLSVEAIADRVNNWLSQHLLDIIIILVIAYIAQKLLAKLITKIIHKTVRRDLFPTESDRKKRIQTLDALIDAASKVIVWTIAIIMIVSEMGVDTGPLIASAGILGVALGFGAQSLIKDFTSGIFIIAENQYRVGDIIKINEISGVVEAITIRTTVLRDLDGNMHHIPNGSIDVTTNMTMDFAGLNEDITVGLDTDIEQLEHIINHVGQQLASDAELKNYITEPPHFERVDGFNNDGLVVKILGKTTPGQQWRVKGELYKRLKHAFDKHGVDIPYPQLTLHQTKK